MRGTFTSWSTPGRTRRASATATPGRSPTTRGRTDGHGARKDRVRATPGLQRLVVEAGPDGRDAGDRHGDQPRGEGDPRERAGPALNITPAALLRQRKALTPKAKSGI